MKDRKKESDVIGEKKKRFDGREERC